ncbi:MAG TPA: hypothetical protein VJZ49_12225 [Syntrophales bacterium]|nr:hypothetical protein [Syntrophales bacterium]
MRVLIYFTIIYFLYRLIKKLFISNEAKHGYATGQPRKTSSAEDLVEDPSCHTYIAMSNAYKASLDSKTLYFCSKKCFEEYAAKQKEGT